MIFKKLYLLMFFVFGLQASIDLEKLNEEYNGKLLSTQDQINGTYQLMKDIHDLFTLYGIEYWIQGGTLVGALRHGGLIHWDDDLDINVDYYHLATLFQLKPVFEHLGYTFMLYHNGMIKICKNREYWIDIFPTKHQDSKTYYVDHWWKREGQTLYLYDEELYPLKLYQFGELQIWGPANPQVYLQCGFGDNYMREVVLYNHRVQHNIRYIFEDLPLKFRNAACNSVPLEDRITPLSLEVPLPNIYF